ncbi:MAG TPA: TspO/MBR family protein [Silvibacterium sp.]|nr:TspO/MBR family protein [Silvibacterium sp.]
MGTQPESRPNSTLALVGWLVLCFAVAAVSSIFVTGGIPTWYTGLVKPPLTPPNQAFGPVWTVLYALMAIAAWIVWKTRPSTCRRRGLRLFCVQLALNLLWTWIFFARHQIGTALANIVVLWVAILLTILTFKKMSTTAAWLLVPYLAWVTFSGYLNFAIWRLN